MTITSLFTNKGQGVKYHLHQFDLQVASQIALHHNGALLFFHQEVLFVALLTTKQTFFG